MRCDECRFWDQGPHSDPEMGECISLMNGLVAIQAQGQMEYVDTMRDFFCAGFEPKDSDDD